MIRRLAKFKRLSGKETESLLKSCIDWQVKTGEEEIDLYLYGGKKG